jgi:GNAT superfamily N-acetyltransferase
MTIRIRKTKTEDSRRVAHVHRSSIKQICGDSYNQDVIDSWAGGCSAEGVRRSVKRKDINNIVAEVDGTIFAVGASINNRIWLLYVHPKWVGKGLGEKVLKCLEKDMLRKNINKITLESSLNAYQFYLRNGYKKVRKKTLKFRSGIQVPCIEMSKTLK